MIHIDGKKIRNELLLEIKRGVAALPFSPVFCDVLVGTDAASVQYVEMKNRMAMQLGIGVERASFPETATTEMVIAKIRLLNADPYLAGLIVQLPLPPHIDKRAVLDAIDPLIDVDATGTENTERFYADDPRYVFPTAGAIMELLFRAGAPDPSQQAVVIGKGELVGRPVAHLLSKKCMTTVIDKTTSEPEAVIQSADIVISAAGQGGLVHGGMVKPGAILIDAGTSESFGSIVGDIDAESVKDIAGMLAPVPGGVGPVTVAMLFKNVLLAAQEKFSHAH